MGKRRMLQGILWDIHTLRNPNMATSKSEILFWKPTVLDSNSGFIFFTFPKNPAKL
jgi:hypothetical protein